MLDAARAVCLKPAIAIDFFPFDRDEAVAAVRRSHAHHNFITCIVLFGIEFDLQLGVFLQGGGNCGVTHD